MGEYEMCIRATDSCLLVSFKAVAGLIELWGEFARLTPIVAVWVVAVNPTTNTAAKITKLPAAIFIHRDFM